MLGRSAIVVFPEIASFILIVMRMPRGYSFDRSSSGSLAMLAAMRPGFKIYPNEVAAGQR